MVHTLGLFGARSATVPHPFLLLALYHGPPRSAAVITPTPLPSVSPALPLAVAGGGAAPSIATADAAKAADALGRAYGSDMGPHGPIGDAVSGTGADRGPGP